MNLPIDPERREKAYAVRVKAAALSTAGEVPEPQPNKDEKSPYLFSFTKGLTHGLNGLLADPRDFEVFAEGSASADPRDFAAADLNDDPFLTATQADFDANPCPSQRQPVRQWESPTAGHAYVLQGPDPYAVSMPQAPLVGSFEFSAEMAEVYLMALRRELPLAALMPQVLIDGLRKEGGGALTAKQKAQLKKAAGTVAKTADRLGRMRWFKGDANRKDTPSAELRTRRRLGQTPTAGNLFRGAGEDGWATPFLSQFMVMGAASCERKLEDRRTGRINYGAQTVDQRVRVATPEVDYMTKWDRFLDVQNGLNARDVTKGEFVDGARRLMSSLRDMATYVHDDALYQAYLNAALILLAERHPFDAGIPYHDASGNPLSRENREPFALFGGPHLLTLVTEVSSRALKAVRLAKFSIHRRLRPEAAGALFHTVYSGYHPQRSVGGMAGQPYALGDGSVEATARRQLGGLIAPYTFPTLPGGGSGGTDPEMEQVLREVRAHNAGQNGTSVTDEDSGAWLLPMAFPEGSPMHPAYGAGHATVAGACVTLLKAFFNMRDPADPSQPAWLVPPEGDALAPAPAPEDDLAAEDVDLLHVRIDRGLTLEGELNKLIWNVSNARNIAGVHYYTDYIESAILGEDITLGILREQMLAYHPAEQVTMTVPLIVERTLPKALVAGNTGDILEGQPVKAVVIRSDGGLDRADPTPGRL
ncbi:MAG: hypothetical protein AAF192_18255 [Pseudomonadota bacterium]